MLEVFLTAWGEMRGTYFIDSDGDNNRLIELFLEYEASFAIRMNVNRKEKDHIVFDERGDQMKMMEIWGKVQGLTGWHDSKNKKQKVLQLQWRKIFFTFQEKAHSDVDSLEPLRG